MSDLLIGLEPYPPTSQMSLEIVKEPVKSSSFRRKDRPA